jgi:hypothetical protein
MAPEFGDILIKRKFAVDWSSDFLQEILKSKQMAVATDKM